MHSQSTAEKLWGGGRPSIFSNCGTPCHGQLEEFRSLFHFLRAASVVLNAANMLASAPQRKKNLSFVMMPCPLWVSVLYESEVRHHTGRDESAVAEPTSEAVCGSLLALVSASHTLELFMILVPLLSLLACSSPTATVATSAHPDAPPPAKLADVLDLKFRRPIQGCYKKALEATPGLSGTVSYQVMGSHGVLKANVTVPGPKALEDCALKPMSDQRLLRDLGDGDDMVGFTITANFSED